mgnify:CR=1 FL=1
MKPVRAPSAPSKPLNPDTDISSPVVLDVFRQIEKVLKNEGQSLSREVNNIGSTHIDMKDGSKVDILIDLRSGKAKISLGKTSEKLDYAMKMSEKTFISLFVDKASPTTAYLYG